MTSETGARMRGEERDAPSEAVDEPTGASGVETPVTGDPVTDAPADDAAAGDGPAERRTGRLLRPLALVLAVLLVLLAGAAAYLWFTRPEDSSVSTDDYAEVLQAARSAVVDFTSFDYLTLDDDIEQVRRVSTGDLRDETVALLESKRQDIATTQAVSNSEIVGAGVTSADSDDATVMLVVESSQQSTASPQAAIRRYRIEVTMEKSEGRWLLSGLTGTDTPLDD